MGMSTFKKSRYEVIEPEYGLERVSEFCSCLEEAVRLGLAEWELTHEKMRTERVVLLVNDTTELDFSTQPHKQGTGTLTYKNQRGYYLHPTLAYTPEKVCLGVVDGKVWIRPVEGYGRRKGRARRAFEEKESYKWMESYQVACEIQQQLATPQVISVGDREGDVFELFVEATQESNRAKLLVRAYQDRRVEGGAKLLWTHMQNTPEGLEIELQVPRKPGQAERVAKAEVRYSAVNLKAPGGKNKGKSVKVYAVYVIEKNVPCGIEPIRWMLLTTLPVRTAIEAFQIVQWYGVRFQIEVFFKELKSGCQIERDQLESSEGFKIHLVLKMILAWRIVYTTMLGRVHPTVSCEIAFTEAEWKALWCYTYKTTKPPATVPTLKEMIILVARLGGYKQWKSDSFPGVSTLWKGYALLDAITSMWMTFQPPSKHTLLKM
jgi:hypothetical protein